MSPVPAPVITTVPLAGWVTEVITLGPASMSVSLASTVTAVAAASSSDGGGVVDRHRRVVDTGDGDRHGGAVAAGEGVGERVGGPPAGVLQ